MRDEEPLRRSMLYLSGAYPQMLAAPAAFDADMFCFDLEDGVPPADKIASRDRIADTLRAVDFGGRERLLRVNALDTEWGHADLRLAATLPLDGVLLPKVEGAADVRRAEAVLDAVGGRALRIWCLIETPLGVLRAEEIASASRRIAGIVIGGADLAETTRTRHTPARIPQVTALSLCVLAARAFGLAIIDAIHPNFRDDTGFEESCLRGVEFGFDGKSIALPATLGIANRVFGPSEDEIAHAHEQVAAAGDAAGGYASLHLLNARRVLARADQIARRAQG